MKTSRNTVTAYFKNLGYYRSTLLFMLCLYIAFTATALGVYYDAEKDYKKAAKGHSDYAKAGHKHKKQAESVMIFGWIVLAVTVVVLLANIYGLKVTRK